jgi:hypothetical protein
VARAISFPARASAVQNPSSSAANSNFPWLSVRPVRAGMFGCDGHCQDQQQNKGGGKRLAAAR